MASDPRITLPVLKVLAAMLANPAGDHYGLAIAQQTGLKSGTLYPILARLERAGWVTSNWEATDPTEHGRPRRRYYRLTGAGERAAYRGLAELPALAAPKPVTRPVWEPT
jgi:PadR family transcriptional regulator, regulatory protein PadR